MQGRVAILALALAPFLIFGALALWRAETRSAVFPLLRDSDSVARIEIAREREQVVLVRRMDTGQWVVASAEDAPGDAARIDGTIAQLAGLRGTALSPDMPPRPREPLELRLSDRDGAEIGHAAFWTGEAIRRSDGVRLALDKTPALPLWPSAWSDLRAPTIAADSVLGVARLSPAGVEVLGVAQVGRVADALSRLSATGFVPARQLNWAGAEQLQVTLTDGARIDVQRLPAADGGAFVRLTSDTRADVRAVRKFAFRVEAAFP
jgi:hypothetical protein